MLRRFPILVRLPLILALLQVAISGAAADQPQVTGSQDESKEVGADEAANRQSLPWLTSYEQGMKQAEREGKMLLLLFHDPQTQLAAEMAGRIDGDERIRRLAERCVRVHLPLSQRKMVSGEEITLVEHAAFAELRKQAGLAMIDLSDPECEHHGHVVSIYPLANGKALKRQHLRVLLDLPTGSLTQRTLIFAVRAHPAKPASTQGEFASLLANESEKHSRHQANVLVQGHHNWDQRFHQINRDLPGNLVAQEVVAESWPGQGLVEAAIDCVDSWRQSSGHWNAVRSRHALFGYDMKRGRNGVWYATGIFARFR